MTGKINTHYDMHFWLKILNRLKIFLKKRNTRNRVCPHLKTQKIDQHVKDVLNLPCFWQFSNQDVDLRNFFLEMSAHDLICCTTGGTKSAFDQIFWLHQCNVDRVLEKCLQINPDSQNQFAKTDADTTRCSNTKMQGTHSSYLLCCRCQCCDSNSRMYWMTVSLQFIAQQHY